ncbi:hypothetical protein BKG82_27625 [Mycobacteroides chelonae]|uniref:Uncharacterized protein n=1 Tax=Mycobacteroides chelonae TaxID=1774 RepID=A0A1S1LGH5_MYCCH|nr:hypothetical protein [Mycobacteroides chelonae]OHU47381.1 hypothetical protein BKG82_27625 [Mycobacteroides chelonae]
MPEFDRLVTESYPRIVGPLKALLDLGDLLPVDRRDALEAGIRSVEELVERRGDELVVRPDCMDRYVLAMVRLVTTLDYEPNPFLGGMRLQDPAPEAAPYIEQLQAQGEDRDYQANGVLDLERFINSLGSQ